jgi:DNA repair exonuclease SbcCD ATPase subunit
MVVPIYALPLPTSGCVRTIVHLADIHIRTGDTCQARYVEYKTVFDRFLCTVSELEGVKKQEAVCILAGDIFHHKNKLEPPGVKLFLDFVKAVASLMPIYIIRGNHDFRQDQRDEPDLIDSLLTLGVEGVCYMQATGHYTVGDVGFGLVAIDDALLIGSTSGIRASLPPFPCPKAFPDSVKHRLALFHGMVAHTKLQNGDVADCERYHTAYPCEWFKGYDAALLGDVHLQQVQRGKPLQQGPIKMSEDAWCLQTYEFDKDSEKHVFAYPGSLVQQDFGEPIMGHGFLAWHLPSHTVKSFHIRNDAGYVAVRKNASQGDGNNAWQVHIRSFESQQWLPFEIATKQGWFPKEVYVQVRNVGKDYGADLAEVERAFGELGVVARARVQSIQGANAGVAGGGDALQEDGHGDGDGLDMLITPDTWIEYVRQNTAETGWEQWVRHPEHMLVPTAGLDNTVLQGRANDRNSKLTRRIQAYVQDAAVLTNRAHMHAPFTIHYMEWEHLLCYGECNHFDFQAATGLLNGINARNGHGKTSFLEVTCLALFGDGFPSRSIKSNQTSIIHMGKPEGAVPFTSIDVGIAGEGAFRIYRQWLPKKGDPQKLNTIHKNIRVTDLATQQVIKCGKAAVDQWVDERIGSVASFLMSCMVTQNVDHDYFKKSAAEQKAMLDKALSLDVHMSFVEVLKEAHLAHQAVQEQVHAALSSIPNVSLEKIASTDAQLGKQKQEAAKAETELLDTEAQWRALQSNLALVPEPIMRLEKNALTSMQERLQGTLALSETHLDDMHVRMAQHGWTYTADNMTDMNEDQDLDVMLADWKSAEYALQQTDRPDSESAQTCVALLEHLKRDYPDCVGDKTVPTDEDTHGLEQSLREAEVELKGHQFLLTQLMNDIPSKPTRSTHEYQSWLKEFGTTKSKHGSLEEVKASLEEICTQLSQYPHEVVAKRPEIVRELAKMRKIVLKDTDTTTSLEETHTHLGDNMILAQQRHVECTQALMRLLSEKPNAPSIHTTLATHSAAMLHVQQAITALQSQLIVQDGLSSASSHVIDHVSELEKELDRLHEQWVSDQRHLTEALTYPFNPECDACRQQPWKVHRDALEQSIRRHEARLHELDTRIGQLLGPYSNLDDMRRDFEVRSQMADLASKSQSLETERPLVEAHEQWHVEKAHLEHNVEDARLALEDLQRNIEAGQQQLKKCALTERLQCIDVVEALSKAKTRLEAAEKVLRQESAWDEHRTQTNAFEKWQADRSKAESNIASCQQKVSDVTAALTHAQRVKAYQGKERIWSALLEQWRAFDAAVEAECVARQKYKCAISNQIRVTMDSIHAMREELGHVTQVLENYDACRDLPTAIERLRTSLVEHTVAAKCLEKDLQVMREHLAATDGYRSYTGVMEARMSTLSMLMRVLSGFHQWAYEKKVLPAIAAYANRVMDFMCTPDNRMSLHYKMSEGCIAWFLQFGECIPPIEKSSGFQLFVASLAMRIALGRLGGVGVRCTQLFIDEGFTACDDQNLENVPTFLRNLLGVYESVFLVSHLEKIKQCVDNAVSITRDGPRSVSMLQYGHKKEVTPIRPKRPYKTRNLHVQM